MIKKLEDTLFEEWAMQHQGVKFARDGVFGSGEWENGQKVVFILKEPHNLNGEEQEWDMRTWDMRKNSHSTWSNVARWGYALQHGDYCLPWDQVRSKGTPASNRYKYTRGLAIVNLNKSGGDAACNYERLIGNFEQRFKSLLTEQIKLYSDAKFVVCCGQSVTDIVRNSKLFGNDLKWQTYEVKHCNVCVRSVPYCYVPNGPLVIGFVHPNIRKEIIKGSSDRNRDAYEILMEVAKQLDLH